MVGALSFRNEFDGHTLVPALEQVKQLTGREPQIASVDKGYSGIKEYGATQIVRPDLTRKTMSRYERKKMKEQLRKCVAIEPTIGHLQQDHRMGRNFLKGVKGDIANILLAAAAYNFKRMMHKWASFILTHFYRIYFWISEQLEGFKIRKMAF